MPTQSEIDCVAREFNLHTDPDKGDWFYAFFVYDGPETLYGQILELDQNFYHLSDYEPDGLKTKEMLEFCKGGVKR